MKYNIRKNWTASLGLMAGRPQVILPFIIIAFLEGLALELIYFFPRKPLLNVAAPVIRKFFGEVFLHYPGNLAILPELFYYAQIVVYISIGALLSAVCANIFKNIQSGLPVKTNALLKNAFRRYLSFFIFGVIVITLMFLVKKLDVFIFSKVMNLTAKALPQVLIKWSPVVFALFLFFSNVILQAFLVLTIPLMVLKKRPLLKALGGSIALGFRNFISIFTLILLPFLIYLPVALLKSAVPKLVDKAFPEISLLILASGIVLALFTECFIVVCASQFVLNEATT
jgi:hypothetical protein